MTRNSKIALCFLLIDRLDHQQQWEEFLSDAPSNQYSVYAHIKSPSAVTPKWLNNPKAKRNCSCGDSFTA